MAMTVLGGFLSATLFILHLTPFPGLMLLSYLAPLPFFLIGLGIGFRPLYGAGFIAAIIVFLAAAPFLAAEFFVFFVLGPIFLINRALLHRKKSSEEVVWYPASLLLRDFTFASGVVMLLALGGYIYLTHGIEPHSLVKTVLKTVDPQGQMRDAEAIFVKLFPFLPGIFAFSWMLIVLFNAALAQGLLIRFNRNLRPSPSLEGLTAPKSFIIVLGLSLILSMVGVGYLELLGKNTIFVLIFPFFLIGLGLIHQWLNKTSFATAGLIIFYLVLILFIWLAFFVILLGILKPWIERLSPPN